MSRQLYAAVGSQLLVLSGEGKEWETETRLEGHRPLDVSIDPENPRTVFCGTRDDGLWRSEDRGTSWEKVGDETLPERVVDVTTVESKDGDTVIWAGTEPSNVYRSSNAGDSWELRSTFEDLYSYPDWFFPPRPETHHVRCIKADPNDPNHLYVAIERGGIVQTPDGGKSWIDRSPGGPVDPHTLAAHTDYPDRLYVGAGDGHQMGRGFWESYDRADSWKGSNDGLESASASNPITGPYVWGIAVDPADAEMILVSASQSPGAAHFPDQRIGYVYRKEGDDQWERCTDGLPDPEETCIPILSATDESV
jgi:photosystem II stability/assembly factor-like uncharacterized protein